MPTGNSPPKRRSGCPLNASVEMLGDRWSLLILRDMMLRGFRSYKQFLESYEGIATHPDSSDGRKLIYSLTPKGIDLAPVLTEMVLWAARQEKTENQALVRQMQKDKQQFLAAIRKRWAERTPSPHIVYKRHKGQNVSPRSAVRPKAVTPSN